jgi:hypothetical protein
MHNDLGSLEVFLLFELFGVQLHFVLLIQFVEVTRVFFKNFAVDVELESPNFKAHFFWPPVGRVEL